jgi:hypothetical protein
MQRLRLRAGGRCASIMKRRPQSQLVAWIGRRLAIGRRLHPAMSGDIEGRAGPPGRRFDQRREESVAVKSVFCWNGKRDGDDQVGRQARW